MADKHLFLSYVREDREHVDALQAALESAGFTVWRDTKDLWPGDNWETKIREAIHNGSLTFLACFSSALGKREVSYQYAELMLAAEEYRLRPMDTSWLMTIRFDECAIPSVDLGGGRHLDKTIHRVDLFGPQYIPQISRLITAIHRINDASPGAPSPAVLKSVAEARRAEGTDVENLRDLIRNPTLTMDYDEHMSALSNNLVNQLQDRGRFPIAEAGGHDDNSLVRAWVARMKDYEGVVAPALEQIKLLAMYGQKSHEQGLSQLMKAIGQEGIQGSGINLYRNAHQYPALVLTYTAALAALVKNDFNNFRTATVDAVVTTTHRIRVPFIAQGGGFAVVDQNWVGSVFVQASDGDEVSEELLNGLRNKSIGAKYTPISDRIYTLLAPLFQGNFASDDDYAQAFDRVEVFFDAISEDARLTNEHFYGGHKGYGRYTWRHRHEPASPEQDILMELAGASTGWTPLLAGMFGGDSERAKTAFDAVGENAKEIRRRRF